MQVYLLISIAGGAKETWDFHSHGGNSTDDPRLTAGQAADV
jgi:hypothetical protein